MFLAFLIFHPNWPFGKGYSLCMGSTLCLKWPILKILSFLEYLVVFRASFFTEQLQCSCGIVFRMFLAFLIFDPKRPFCKAYSLCMGYTLCLKWPIFKILSFLEYLVVFPACFFHRTTLMFLWNCFSHVSGIVNFSPKLTIWQRL